FARSRAAARRPGARGRGTRLSPGALSLLLLRSAVGTCGIFANFYALGLVPIADGQALNKTAPFFTVAFAWAFLGEKASLRQVGALALAFAGVALVVKPGFSGGAAFPLAIGLLGGACAGGAYACVRSLRRRAVEPAFIVLFFSAFSCLASVPFMLARFDPMSAAQVAVLLCAGAGAALGQFGVTLAYGYAAPRDIAVYDYSNILFTAAFGLILFGQVPDACSALGFALILAAAVRLNRP
ncbi:MAG: DMT family transporter, partial [Kiritimatiellae bacterium]|nr:DMT family transporter [Kiritimatiellia bacterium]